MLRVGLFFFMSLPFLTVLAQEKTPSTSQHIALPDEPPLLPLPPSARPVVEPPVMPQVQITADSEVESARLRDIAIDIKIIDNIVVTTWDMTLYNPQNSVSEGELLFPLQDGKVLTRFAIEANGKLRKGVPAAKNKCRATFKEIVRRNIDTRLLEKIEDNFLMARVYPIPAMGTRRTVVAYKQEMENPGRPDSDSLLYVLPLTFQDKLDTFSLRIEVFDPSEKPVLGSPLDNFQFQTWCRGFAAEISMRDYTPDQPVFVTVPVTQNKAQAVINQKNNSAMHGGASILPITKDQ